MTGPIHRITTAAHPQGNKPPITEIPFTITNTKQSLTRHKTIDIVWNVYGINWNAGVCDWCSQNWGMIEHRNRIVLCSKDVCCWPRMTLQWLHNGHGSVSNHQPYDCLLNGLFKRRSKKTSKLRVTGFVQGIHRRPVNSPHKWPVTRKMFPFDDVIMEILQLMNDLYFGHPGNFVELMRFIYSMKLLGAWTCWSRNIIWFNLIMHTPVFS